MTPDDEFDVRVTDPLNDAIDPAYLPELAPFLADDTDDAPEDDQ